MESSLAAALLSLPRFGPAAGGTHPVQAGGPELLVLLLVLGKWGLPVGIRCSLMLDLHLPGEQDSTPRRVWLSRAPQLHFRAGGLLRSRVSAAFPSPPPACIWRLNTGTQIASS